MKTDQQPKFCVNCRWYKPRLFLKDQCSHPTLLNKVTGKAEVFCSYARDFESDEEHELCGPEAKLREERV